MEDLTNAELRTEVTKLMMKHAKLKAEAAQRPLGALLADMATETAASGAGDGTAMGPISEKRVGEITERVKQNSKRRKIDSTHIGYRITGHTIFPLTPHRSGIRFETSYNGEYFEQYYVIIEFDGENNATVHRHTLPSFIPITAELGPLLGKSLKRFMASTTLYLNAFVARRQQVLAVQEQHAGHLVGEIETTPAFDFVKLVAAVDGDDGELLTSVRLVYEDLTSQLPSRVVVKEVEKHAADDDNDDDGEAGPIHPPSVSALDTPSAIRNRAVEKQFRTTPLHEALDEYL